MSLAKRNYLIKTSNESHSTEKCVYVDEKELNAAIKKVYEQYADNDFDAKSYLIHGSVVIVGTGWIRLTNETLDGLEALAKDLGLPQFIK